jgi:hypothetical protein
MKRERESEMTYTVTDTKLATEFKTMNSRFFGSFLELDALEIDDLDTEWGFCVDDDDEWVLGVTREFPTKKAFQETLLHEMAHLFQLNADMPVDHNETFFEWCDVFLKEGFNVD